MAFDDKTRRALLKTVTACRNLLTEDFDEQLRGRFGIYADEGRVLEIDRLPSLTDTERETARILRERIDHLAAGKGRQGISDAVHRIRREQAFTVLNRFAALRMAEERGVIRPSVGSGFNSTGFQIFERAAGGEQSAAAAFGSQYDRYLVYLDCLFDELSLDLGVLFDRTDAMGLLFPSENGLRDLFTELNSPDVAHLWSEDETIGWIYQYYNDPEERKRMRKESAAPRNSRELAVRNQFFTPRYVVEFLTDNTLGRIWYEMCRGQTRLKDQCRYLVRRPNEIFLAEGEVAPETPDQEGFSQEELLVQPVHIPHRLLKNPREIRLLDPACGSMHFGLYAFDLFEVIYEEAWDNDSCPALQEAYASKGEFLKDVPRLIIEHNIHGVDIDPRAAQIAGLSLWLRAQKAWENQQIKPAERPQVRRSNIVCAEPMPGSTEMLEEFIATLDPPLIGELVKTVFAKMQLAGEAGSLLKIEEEIRIAIETTRKEWLIQHDDLLARRDDSKEEFFDTAEQQVIDALRVYAEQADADSYQRRLFADDAARGFAFIDLCRKHYDVVVMNPPFGDWSSHYRAEARLIYPISHRDIMTSFIERGGSMLSAGGRLGAITSRTCFFLSSYSEWREKIVLEQLSPMLFADLGHGVMDAAMVEAAAYVLAKDKLTSHHQMSCFRLVSDCDPMPHLLNAVLKIQLGEHVAGTTTLNPRSFWKIPNAPFAYWANENIRDLYKKFSQFESGDRKVRQGGVTGNDERYLRLAWEVDPLERTGTSIWWAPFAKGGKVSPFCSDIPTIVKWDATRSTFFGYTGLKHRPSEKPSSADSYFKKGLTWPLRATRFAPVPLPMGSIFTIRGYAIIAPDNELLALLSIGNSSVFDFLFKLSLGESGRPEYVVGTLKLLPLPNIDTETRSELAKLATRGWRLRASQYRRQVTAASFCLPFLDSSYISLDSGLRECCDRIQRSDEEIISCRTEIDQLVAPLYGFGEEELSIVERFHSDEDHASEADSEEDPSEDVSFDPAILVSSLLDYTIGCGLGLWDIRYANGIRQPPELTDPFDQLPVCPPGMLQNAAGLPAVAKDVPADYPLRISWPGILVDDENHPEDIVARVREAIEVIWKDRAEAIEAEACEILEVKARPKEGLDALRVYFRDPSRFFKDHLARYSKSARKAPIYWPLSTDSGSYTLWIYYHRLNRQTLFTCIEMIDLKREDLGRENESLRSKIGSEGSVEERQKIEEQATFLAELKTLRGRLLEVTNLPYHPDLNDGVQITAAPLWQCFRHSPWQKVLKQTWSELTKGKYDWSHLAMSIWSDRVVLMCAKDRSLAIAHGVDDLLWVPDLSSKKKDQLRPLKSPDDELKLLKQAGHSKEDLDKAAEDVTAAEKSGLRTHLWIEQPPGIWRRRKSPKEEIENEIARRRGR
jgi:hypothetical protein